MSATKLENKLYTYQQQFTSEKGICHLWLGIEDCIEIVGHSSNRKKTVFWNNAKYCSRIPTYPIKNSKNLNTNKLIKRERWDEDRIMLCESTCIIIILVFFYIPFHVTLQFNNVILYSRVIPGEISGITSSVASLSSLVTLSGAQHTTGIFLLKLQMVGYLTLSLMSSMAVLQSSNTLHTWVSPEIKLFLQTSSTIKIIISSN